MMEKYGITYVLNVSKTCTQPSFIDGEHFHRISVRDNYQEKMMPYMSEAITFIGKYFQRCFMRSFLIRCFIYRESAKVGTEGAGPLPSRCVAVSHRGNCICYILQQNELRGILQVKSKSFVLVCVCFCEIRLWRDKALC